MMAYPTTANLKDWLKISGSGDDTVLGWILDGAIDEWETQCGRVFVASGGVRDIPVKPPYVVGRRLLWFDDTCIVTTIWNGDGEEVADTEYFLLGPHPYHGVELYPDSAVRWQSVDKTPIQVQATWGYNQTCPNDVFVGVLELAAHRYRMRSSGGTRATSEGRRQGAVAAGEAIPTAIRYRMDRWRRYGG